MLLVVHLHCFETFVPCYELWIHWRKNREKKKSTHPSRVDKPNGMLYSSFTIFTLAVWLTPSALFWPERETEWNSNNQTKYKHFGHSLTNSLTQTPTNAALVDAWARLWFDICIGCSVYLVYDTLHRFLIECVRYVSSILCYGSWAHTYMFIESRTQHSTSQHGHSRVLCSKYQMKWSPIWLLKSRSEWLCLKAYSKVTFG